MTELTNKACIPCQGGIPPLSESECEKFIKELHPDWKVINNHHLERNYLFSNFVEGLAFTNILGALAEKEGHHPDIYLSWGKVKVTVWTHKIDGLTESDFIWAAKSDIKHAALTPS